MTAVRREVDVLNLDGHLELTRRIHAGAYPGHLGAREILHAMNRFGVKASPRAFVGTERLFDGSTLVDSWLYLVR